MFCKKCKPFKKFICKTSDFEKKVHIFNSAYRTFREMALSGEIEYIAGDCPLEDIENWLDNLENFVFFKCYFRCKDCGKIFWVGAYCRGEPGCLLEKGVPGLDIPAHSDYWDKIKGKYGTWQSKKEWKINKDK